VSASSRRAARHELQVARSLGTRRVTYRGRYQRSPDMLPVRLPNGLVLSVEATLRDNLPRLLTSALSQALRYGGPDCVPVAALREHGGQTLVVTRLEDFLQLSGIEPVRETLQPLLLARSM
jgi:hypothetical protein